MMRIYLVQHGRPVSKEENPQRPLSDAGRDDVRKMAEALKAAGVSVAQVFHSGKLRAQQTAEIIASVLGQNLSPLVKENISPLDDPSSIASELPDLGDGTMIVGHLPHLGKLVSLLVAGNQETEVARFQQGGVVCLEADDSGNWAVAWMLVPQLLG